MQLVMKRDRLESNFTWQVFKINARLVLDEEENALVNKYNLFRVVLTPGNTPRDLRRAAWIAGIAALLLNLILVRNIAASILLFLVFSGLVYAQIREEVRVGDLITGRNFKARSLVQLLVKEQRIRKMSGVFAIVIEQARTWHEPEVIPIEPQPLGIILAPTPEGNYEVT